MKKYMFITILMSLISLVTASCNDESTTETVKTVQHFDSAPKLQGTLIYHNYSSYDAMDSKMWSYDFQTNTLKCISENWDITNPMNAHFSPDGKKIVFMGIDPTSQMWSLYLYELGSSAAPENLSSGSNRDEDPKFSPDGTKITFKRDFKVMVMDLASRVVTKYSPTGYSMPYFNHDGTKLICSFGDAGTSYIAVIDMKNRKITKLYDSPGLQDYYPINADNESFYYSSGHSIAPNYDQVYRGFWNGLRSKRLPFNGTDGDYSDAYPINSEWVLISSTREGTRGMYDLYIAHVETGDIFPMTDYNKQINTTNSELGGCVYIKK